MWTATVMDFVKAFVLLILTSSGLASIITCSTCERGSILSCPNSLYKQYEVSYQKGNLVIECDFSTKELNLTWLEGCNFSSVMYVRINLCPLFDESLGNVLKKIGVNASEVKYLVWENSHAVDKGLQSWHLEGLPNLSTLHLQNNYFSSIPGNLLEHVPLVTRIVINENHLDALPQNFFSFTPRIVSIELGRNTITSLPDSFLSKLPSLSVFTLTGNVIPTIPNNFFEFNPLLKTVDLDSNKLQSIQNDTFKNLKNLQALNLRNNELRTVSDDLLSDCFNLSTIYLSHNKFTTLPSKLFQKTKLKIAYLEYNKLSNISGLFQNLPTLENVTLHKNEITELPSDSFKGSSNLVRLDLQFNYLTTLHQGVLDGQTKLSLILLNSNAIEKLPRGLYRDCISLNQVYMQKNKLSTIPLNTFPKFSKIGHLDLSFNNITFDSDQFFNTNPLNELTSIEKLYLSNNRITEISTDFLYIFTNLKILDLSYNSLSVLHNSDLYFMSSNVTLLLQYNSISSIRIDRNLGHTEGRKTLALSLLGNPLDCDCYVYEFLRFAQLEQPFPMNEQFNLLVDDAPNLLCSSPEDLSSTSIDKVDITELVCDFPCSEQCPCLIRQHDRALLMDCSNKMIKTAPNFTEDYINFFQDYDLKLDLSGNELDNIDFLTGPYFSRLVNLSLADNNLNSVNESLLNPDLVYLDLRDNNFTAMSSNLVNYLNQTKISILLGRNPWWCNCGLHDFYEFIRDNFERVLDRTQVVCEEDEIAVQDKTIEELCPLLLQPAALGSIVAVVLILLLGAVLVTAAWYRHKEFIKVWLYTHNLCLWAVTEEEIDADKVYDAFVSYSYKDESFVNSTLVPGLESSDPPYKVCLHYRDWVPGEYIADQIMTSVKESRRIVVVLSKNFLESVWGQMEFKAAHRQALKDKTNRIIVIIYGEVPNEDDLDDELKLYVTSKTYLKWGDQRFWERLRYAMPHSKLNKRIKKSKVADQKMTNGINIMKHPDIKIVDSIEKVESC